MGLEFTTLLALVNSSVDFLKHAKSAIPPSKHGSTITIDFSHHESAVIEHAKTVNSWASDVQMKAAKRSLSEILVKPSVYAGDDRRNTDGASAVSPLTLLQSSRSIAILGGPGAGKTTIMKVIASHVQTEPPSSAADTFQMPLLFRLRELKESESLTTALLRTLGIHIDMPSLSYSVRYGRDSATAKERADFSHLTHVQEHHLCEVLNRLSVVLLLDGLDELPAKATKAVIGEISRYIERLSVAGVILTCRHGAYTTQVTGADVFSVEPFTDDQVHRFAEKWLGSESKANAFIQRLRKTPYSDVARTPLHATNLCMIYEKLNDLPAEHSKIYDKILDIRIREWDVDRGVTRIGGIDGFDHSEKRKLLSNISFEMAKDNSSLIFSIADFSRAMRAVAPRFRLESHNSREILQELESHTGVIFYSGFENYEYYHKTFQEYLCGEFLAGVPLISEYYVSMLLNMPDVCAMATLLSNDRDAFAWALNSTLSKISITHETLLRFWSQYWSRVCLENTRFSGNKILGAAISGSVNSLLPDPIRPKPGREAAYTAVAEIFRDVAALPGVKDAVNSLTARSDSAKSSLTFGGIDWYFGTISRVGSSQSVGQIAYPKTFFLPASLF